MIRLRLPGPNAARRANLRVAARAAASGRRRVAHRPVEAFLEVVRDCNIRCTMCAISFDAHYARGPLDERGQMPWAVFERAQGLLRRAVKVHLMGTGEPLLHPDLPRMVEQLRRRGAWVTFNTNGTLLTPPLAQRLRAAELSQIVVSLDAARPETFAAIRRGASLPMVLDNVKELMSEAGAPELVVAAVLMRKNLDELEELVELSAHLGARFLHLEPLLWQDDPDYIRFYEAHQVERDEAAERVAALRGVAERHGIGLESPLIDPVFVARGDSDTGPICTEPWTTLYVTREGALRACCNAVEDLGRLAGRSGGWNDNGFRRYRRDFGNAAVPAGCQSCYKNQRYRKVLAIDGPMVGIAPGELPREVR